MCQGRLLPPWSQERTSLGGRGQVPAVEAKWQAGGEGKGGTLVVRRLVMKTEGRFLSAAMWGPSPWQPCPPHGAAGSLTGPQQGQSRGRVPSHPPPPYPRRPGVGRERHPRA